MLIAHNFFSASIFLWHIKFITSELETRRGSPSCTIMAINSSELAHVSDLPGIGFRVELVADLVYVGVPRHFVIFVGYN